MRAPKLRGAAVVLVTLLACGASVSSFAQPPIRVGATMSITGNAYSVQGGYGREGYLLCQKHVNAQGGVLGRPIELVILDDQSDEKTAARLYEKLIVEDKVDAILGPYGSAITEAVADVPERYQKLMIAANAATTSIWEKGRRYLIMVLAPVDSTVVGVLDVATRSGLKRVAIIAQDALVSKAVAKATSEEARKLAMDVVLSETYATGMGDFSSVLNTVKAANPEVLVTTSIRLDDLVAITRKMKDLDLNVKMLASLPYGLLPEFQQRLGKDAEFVYSATFWEPALQNPGNQEFVAAYEKEFKRPPAVQSANSYAGCQIFAEAVRRAGTTDSDKLRDAVLALRTKTILGDFAVDGRGFQVGQKAVTIQWQDGKNVVVWPNEVASDKPRPTPPWSMR